MKLNKTLWIPEGESTSYPVHKVFKMCSAVKSCSINERVHRSMIRIKLYGEYVRVLLLLQL